MKDRFEEWWKTVECNETRERHTRFCGADVSLIREAFEAGAKAERTLFDEMLNMDAVLNKGNAQNSVKECEHDWQGRAVAGGAVATFCAKCGTPHPDCR